MLEAARSDPVVLVVDDEPANQRALRRALLDECRVRTAGSGSEALEILRGEAIALVRVDQTDAGMTGIELPARSSTAPVGDPRRPHRIHRHRDRDDASIRAASITSCTALEVADSGSRPARPRTPCGRRRTLRLHADLERACTRVRREAEQKGRLLALTTHELEPPPSPAERARADRRRRDAAPCRVWMDTARRASRGWRARRPARRSRPMRRAAFSCVPTSYRSIPSSSSCLARARADGAGGSTSRGDRRGWRSSPTCAGSASALEPVDQCSAFTPDGGRIDLESLADRDEVVVAVSDTGTGIAARTREIFEPFSAATGSAVHGSGAFTFGARGLGLGLALVRRVAEAHGGSVAVQSAVGEGSRFALHLPRAR